MKLNHRQRKAQIHCYRQAAFYTKIVKIQQRYDDGKADPETVKQANMWRERFTRYYFKLHPDA